jgi:cyclopropane fatty-acyl-phospholipid synthase-like methyltransferase
MTIDRDQIDAYWRLRTAIADPVVASRHRENDAPKHDLAFIGRFVTEGCTVLDLGAGSCVLADRLAALDRVARVCAVEKFGEFFEKRPAHPKVETHTSDVRDFRDPRAFDLVLLFGVLNYFDEPEARAIYERCRSMLAPTGRLLVKHQCGVSEDVAVDGYSEELGHRYQAIYRSRAHELALLAEHFTVDEIVDVYPPELNRHANTHFYGFVCRTR